MAETKDNRTDIRSETSEAVHSSASGDKRTQHTSSASGDKRTPASAPKRKPGRPRKTDVDSSSDKKTPGSASRTPDKKTPDDATTSPDKKTPDSAPVKKKRSRPDNTAQPAPGDNTAIMLHNLTMMHWQKPDMTNKEDVFQRITDYFQLCADNDMKPSVEGLSLAFGVSRTTMWMWVNGAKKFIPPEVVNTLKIAYLAINATMTEYMQSGKINPVAGIFLMKNNMGYTDQTEVVVKPSDQGVTPVAPEQLAETYLSNMADVIEAED